MKKQETDRLIGFGVAIPATCKLPNKWHIHLEYTEKACNSSSVTLNALLLVSLKSSATPSIDISSRMKFFLHTKSPFDELITQKIWCGLLTSVVRFTLHVSQLPPATISVVHANSLRYMFRDFTEQKVYC